MNLIGLCVRLLGLSERSVLRLSDKKQNLVNLLKRDSLDLFLSHMLLEKYSLD